MSIKILLYGNVANFKSISYEFDVRRNRVCIIKIIIKFD